ncbi:MAG: ParA family protein [Burkholderiaceae bacterium]
MTANIVFFNNKGGVGKTSLVYHCAWMFAEQGLRVLAVDLDPQSNLSIMALDEERLAMEARKPMFGLTSADGAIGAHQTNVRQCHDDFASLVQSIAARAGVTSEAMRPPF